MNKGWFKDFQKWNAEREKLHTELAAARVYEAELEAAAEVLQRILPIGEVKAIGLREVTAGIKEIEIELTELREELAAAREYKEAWLKTGEELVHWQNRASEQDHECNQLRERCAVLEAENSRIKTPEAIFNVGRRLDAGKGE